MNKTFQFFSWKKAPRRKQKTSSMSLEIILQPELGMASISVDIVDHIYNNIEILIVADGERRKHGVFSPSIYRVPQALRRVSKNSYTPRVVSIGPFHKNMKVLKEAENHKLSYVGDLFIRVKSSREQAMKACLHMLLPKLAQIKACYEGKMKPYDDHEFVKMMVIDGCFILELIYRSKFNKKASSTSFFDNTLLSLYVKHDLLLLENQIPFFVLVDIFDITIGKLEPTVSLANLVLQFLSDMNPFGKELLLDKDEANTKHDHILGLLQKCYQHAHGHTHTEQLKSKSGVEFLNAISYSVTDLALAGVKFRPNTDEKWLLAMEFKSSRVPLFCWSWRKPTFKMPLLKIEDYTESVLRNLIAYEQCSDAIPNYVTSYAFAMERILDTKGDVLKVIDSKVLINNLGSSEQASDMINSICKEVTVKDFCYTKQWQQIENYYNGYWPKNVAWLRRTYFNTPWSFIALLAGFLLFGLTVAQTYFTIRPV